MRIIFMGSPDFAVPSLEALVGAGHEIPRPIAAAAAAPGAARQTADRSAERARRWHRSVHAGRLKTTRSRRVRGARCRSGRRRGLWADPAAADPRGAARRLHQCPCGTAGPGARRGADQRAIVAGDPVSGVTIMRMDEGLDTGPMLLRRELMIDGKNAGQATESLRDWERSLARMACCPGSAGAPARRRHHLRGEGSQG